VPRSALAPASPSPNQNIPGASTPDAAQLQRTLKSNSLPDYGNFPNMMPGGMGAPGSMPSITPDQLPSLLSTSATEGAGPGAEDEQGGMGGSGLLRGLTSGGAGSTDYTGLASMFGGSPLGQGDPLAGVTGSTAGSGASSITAASLPGKHPGIPEPEPMPAQPLRRKTNPYADVPSLYDMYAQFSKTPATLRRFGADVFVNGTGNVDDLPMDLPVGPDYVVGAGDFLNID